jgi:hypothetical protein
MKFTFTKKRSDHPIEDNQANTTTEFESIELGEIVANFEDFLRGCGFRFDGVLDFVEDEK